MYKRGTFTGKLISLERFYSRHISFLFEESEKRNSIFIEKREEKWTGKKLGA